MAIEAKEVIEFLGLKPDEIQSIDQFKEKFTPTFLRRSEAHSDVDFIGQVYGKKSGQVTTVFKRELKNMGIEIPDAEIENKTLEDIVRIGVTKAVEKYSTDVTAVKDQANKGNDEKVVELASKYEKEKKKREETEGLLNSTKTEFDTFKTNKDSEFKGYKLKSKRDQYHAEKVKWNEGIPEVSKTGYFAELEKNFKFEWDDEKGDVIPMDLNGNRIPNKDVAGTFKTYDQVLQDEGIRLKTWPVNPHQQKGFNPTAPKKAETQNIEQPQNGRVRKLSPQAAAAAGA